MTPNTSYEKFADSNHLQQMTDYAHDIAEALNVNGDVEVVTSEGLKGKKKQAKGWYDPKTGKITIVADNHTNAADIEQTDASTAWDALMEQTEGDEAMAHEIADEMVKDKTADLAKVENEPIAKGKTPTEKLAARKAHKAKVEQAKLELEQWKAIANVDAERKAKAAVERQEAEIAKAEEAIGNGNEGLRNVRQGRTEGHSDQGQGDLAEAGNTGNVGNGRQDGTDETNTDKVTPIGESDFGFVYDQFKGNAQGAIRQLMKMLNGEALGALHHDEIGDIDLVWGKAGTRKSDGYGLAKLVKFHPEVLDNLQGILDGMHITKRSENRVQLENDEYQAAVRLTWNGEEKLWLLTAFKKKETPEPTNSRTDVDSNLDGKSDDTATRQSSDVSVDKDINNQSTLQENDEKSREISGIDWTTYDKAPKNEAEWTDMMRFEYEGRPVPEAKDMRAMKRFVDKVLSGDKGIDETINEWLATRSRSAEIDASGLYQSEKGWFSPKKHGDFVAFYDEGEKAVYKLSAVKDRQGYLNRVILTKETFANAPAKEDAGEDISQKAEKAKVEETQAKDAVVENTEEPKKKPTNKVEQTNASISNSSESAKNPVENNSSIENKPKKQKLSPKKREAMESIANALGYKVVWHDSMEENGYINYAAKEIHIAEDANNPIEMVFGHEATHAVRNLSKEDFSALRDAVKKLMGDDWWNVKIPQFGIRKS